MLKLKNVIKQLEDKDYQQLTQNFNETKANKYALLLGSLRENNVSDRKMMEMLEVNVNAFYTLKSRLYDKVQDYLINNLDTPKIELFRKVANIPNLLFNADKDTAQAVLTKLEKDLIDYDLPYELTSVYSALKKIHLNTQKYYHYSQLYNKHVAQTLAQDKIEDLLTDFHKKLGDYHSSRDASNIELLVILLEEISKVNEIYDSHHLFVYKSIADISFKLFVPSADGEPDGEPIEDALEQIEKVIKQNPTDSIYQYLSLVYNFLSFEYYHQLNVHRKEVDYFEYVNSRLPSFMLFNFCTVPTRFLKSKIERYVRMGIESQLWEENQALIAEFQPDPVDVPNFINYMKYLAVSSYYNGKLEEAEDYLTRLQNEVSFKNYPQAELEVKLLMALFYSLQDEYDIATNLLRRVSDKVREMPDDRYENVKLFVKLLKTQMKTDRRRVKEKLYELRDRFLQVNKGPDQMLEYLKIDDTFVETMSKVIKN
ncbi:MAG: hypothetical protein IIA45_02015 [Bacteroidetes bacterium]|nr:hypothetical protein [Bacteroidota bacterium]